MRSLIAGVVGIVGAFLLMAFLQRTTIPAARKNGMRYVLEYGASMRSLGVVVFALGGVFLFAASRMPAGRQTLAWTVAIILALSSAYIFLEVFFVRVQYDDEFIYAFSPWRGSRQIPWSEITSYDYSSLNRWHILHTRTQGTLRVSTFMSGTSSFLDRLRKTTAG